MAVSSIVDYASLQNALADYLIRTDLTTQIQLAISLAEMDFQRTVRNRQMEVSFTTSTVVGQQDYALPTDFLETREFLIQGNPIAVLQFRTPMALNELYRFTYNAMPRDYTIFGQNVLLGPVPDAVYTLQLDYYQKIPALASATGNTNWLVQRHPDLYLFGSLIHLYRMLNDDAQVQSSSAIYQRLLSDLGEEEAEEQWNGAPLVPTRKVPTP